MIMEDCVGNHPLGPVPATGRLAIRLHGKPEAQTTRPMCHDCRIVLMARLYDHPRVASMEEVPL